MYKRQALQRHSDMHYSIITYQEHALNVGSNSQACAYVGVQEPNGTITWGAGIHEDIITASVLALISAVNRLDPVSYTHLDVYKRQL